jgi:hypothetical protein
MFPEDPSSFMADFGSPVIFGSQTTMALFDRPDHDVLSGRAQSTAYCIEYPSKDLIGLARGDVVLIGITPGWKFDATGKRLQFAGACPETAVSGEFKVISPPDVIDDGTFTRADLEKL